MPEVIVVTVHANETPAIKDTLLKFSACRIFQTDTETNSLKFKCDI